MADGSSGPAWNTDHPPDDPTLSNVVPDRVVYFRCLGFLLRFETDDWRVEVAARDSFGPSLPEPDCAVEESAEYTIRLLVHDIPEPPGWRPVQPVIREQDGYFSITSSRATVVTGDGERGFAFGFVSHRAADHREFLRSAVVQSAFFSLATRRTVAAVHSACVWKAGTTLMLRGAPNAGKSTLAYAALKAGYSMIAEDVVFVRTGDGGFELHGVPWWMYLKPDAVRFFPELAEEAPVERFNGERKIRIDLVSRFPEQARASAHLGPMVFVGRSSDGRDHLVRLDDNETIRLLHGTAIEAERRQAGPSGLWDAMLELPAYRLEVGNDPERAARELDALVGDGSSG